MQLHLIRHTTPAVASGVCYGRSDVDVAASFATEVQSIRHKISHIRSVANYSSPLSRCSRLAFSLELRDTRHDARLMELDFGDWEMQAWEEIPREHLDRWGKAYTHTAPPGGETFTELHGRASAFLQEQLARHHGHDVVAVTHAGVIRALLADALNLSLTEVFRFHLDFGSVTQLRMGSGYPVVGYVNR
ncbi:phosphoserine phosphatase 1 [mine drainage metagenome]|uniref:Phosphoserine phosphatase 1 n=1 Tax=mine drainage metagenome TaxID=410659 RepID=A0A1J5RAY6_9ZZZZ